MLLLQLIRMARRFRGKRGTAFVAALGFLLLCLLGNAITFYAFDRAHQDGLTFGDALWYSVISITTIGYGDYSAQSFGARLGTVVFIVVFGLTAFSMLFGITIDAIASHLAKGQKGTGTVMANDHVLIVNCPSVARVEQIIQEIQSDSERTTEMVLVADNLDESPFDRSDVLFVRGSTHDAETYRRAKVQHARMAIILSRDYGDPNSDAVVAAAAGVIDRLHPETHIVAECIDARHRPLFEAVRCDAIVPGLQIAGNLLVQEVHDPGISQMIEVITSNRVGATVYSTRVEADAQETYRALAARLLERNINLLAYARAGETFTEFPDAPPCADDRVIYIARQRQAWPALSA